MENTTTAPCRDQIAMAAISGVMSGGGIDIRNTEVIVKRAYEIADEMIKQRDEYNELYRPDPEDTGDDGQELEPEPTEP